MARPSTQPQIRTNQEQYRRSKQARPTPQRFQHDILVDEIRETASPDGGVARRERGLKVVTQTPLDRYLAHRHISQDQWAGGDRLREDFERGDFEMLAQVRYDGMPGGGVSDIAEISLAACQARKSYIAALRALPQQLSPVIVHVCCLRQYAADWAVMKSLPKSDGMALLRLGLDILHAHYTKGRRPNSGSGFKGL